MQHVMPRSQSLCFSFSWDSTLSHACWLRMRLAIQSWLATVRAWWMCPSGGAVKGMKGNAGAGAGGLLLIVLSLVISKYQTHAGTSGNLLELDIQPGTSLPVTMHLNCLWESHLLIVHRNSDSLSILLGTLAQFYVLHCCHMMADQTIVWISGCTSTEEQF